MRCRKIDLSVAKYAFAGLAACLPETAFAHASDRGYVLLLPTSHYIVGGALAVAASFIVLLFIAPGALSRLAAWRRELFSVRMDVRAATSLAAFALLAILVFAGFLGSRDPLSNPLPLVVWTLFWIGVTLASGVFGNFFAWVNPWYGVYRLVAGRSRESQARDRLSARFGYLPAIVQFAAFAWFELVDIAPEDPARLAWAVSIYWAINFAAMLVFGYDLWTRQGECFSVFFRLVSRLSIFEAVRADGRRAARLCLPGGKLHAIDPLPLSGVVFLLLVLGSVSFDGFMRTFTWLGLVGVNPLEFPGRSTVAGVNTLGLFAMATALALAFFLSVWAGDRLSGASVGLRRAAGLLVWSILPIALCYHFAHYLIAFLVNGQYAIAALSDPFSLGWNLFGTAANYISVGLVMGPRSAFLLWNVQAAAIVGGHVFAVLIAHGLAARLYGATQRAMFSQLPLTFLMIGYTVFGLWLLSTPTGA